MEKGRNSFPGHRHRPAARRRFGDGQSVKGVYIIEGKKVGSSKSLPDTGEDDMKLPWCSVGSGIVEPKPRAKNTEKDGMSVNDKPKSRQRKRKGGVDERRDSLSCRGSRHPGEQRISCMTSTPDSMRDIWKTTSWAPTGARAAWRFVDVRKGEYIAIIGPSVPQVYLAELIRGMDTPRRG